MAKYTVDVTVWNKAVRWGYLTVKLHSVDQEAVATIDQYVSSLFLQHPSVGWGKSSQPSVSVVYVSTAFEFKRFAETRLFAQFDKDIKSVKKISLKFSTGNVLKPKYKLRVLRVRLTPLERKER